MTPTQKVACESVAVGTAAAALIGWFVFPSAVWWIHAAIWVLAVGGYYKQRLNSAAAAALLDAHAESGKRR